MLGQLTGGNIKRYIFSVLSLLRGRSPVDTEPTRQEVNVLRGLHQTGKYSNIYRIILSDSQTATPEKKFIDITNGVREEDLGIYKEPIPKTEKIIRGLFSNGEAILIYFSEYSKKIVQEVFVFNVKDRKVRLKGYRYGSIN